MLKTAHKKHKLPTRHMRADTPANAEITEKRSPQLVKNCGL